MVNASLDREWVALIKQAKELGLTPEEIKEFLLVNGSAKKTAIV